MSISIIKPKDLGDLLDKGNKVDILDVRTPVEYREVHVENAHNIPLELLASKSLEQIRSRSSNDPFYLICRSGGRGQQACEKLIAMGLTNVVNVEGGTMACVEAGLPVIRGKKAISLERQVRIAAGSLVLVGVALGLLVHPLCIGLSVFVGAGLVFAGVTDTCGMGMILARMPWNQCSESSGS